MLSPAASLCSYPRGLWGNNHSAPARPTPMGGIGTWPAPACILPPGHPASCRRHKSQPAAAAALLLSTCVWTPVEAQSLHNTTAFGAIFCHHAYCLRSRAFLSLGCGFSFSGCLQLGLEEKIGASEEPTSSVPKIRLAVPPSKAQPSSALVGLGDRGGSDLAQIMVSTGGHRQKQDSKLRIQTLLFV